MKKQITFLKRNIDHLKSAGESKKLDTFIIFIEPWKINPLPMYAITLAMLLKIRGLKVSFLISEAKFDTDHFIQLFGIKFLLNFLKNYIPTYTLKDFHANSERQIKSTDHQSFKQLAFANAVHLMRGENDSLEFKKNVERNYKIYIENFSSIISFMDLNKDACYIIPGGIFGITGLLLDYAKKINTKYYTYDSGFGVLLTSVNGVAAHCKDIPISLDLILKQNDPTGINFAIEQAKIELDKRLNGNDISKTQIQSYAESLNFNQVGVLIPLNSPWDSATLRIDYLFESYRDWLLQTVDLVLKNSYFNVTIRQHPDERHWYGKSNLDFGVILKEIYGDNSRIQYIACTDKVNTYALLDKAKFVICFSSTFGIEASLRNKKVIVCSDVYYSELDFVTKPKNKIELARIISEFDTYEGLNSEQEKHAMLCYYLGQKCNWLYSIFTPTANDFDRWTKKDLKELLEDNSVEILLDSVEYNLPVSYINHKKMLKNRISYLHKNI
nr:hypothetical protein [Pedobacter ureilyticus]